jgi:hypothetical protein
MASYCFSCVILVSTTIFSIANNPRMYVLIHYFVFLCHYVCVSLRVFVFLYHKRPELLFLAWCWDWFFACIHSDGNPCNKFANNPSCSNPCKEFFCSNPYKDLLAIFGRIFLVVVICISLDSSFLCKERGDITMWWLSNLIHCCERIWSCSCFLHDNFFLLSMLSCWCLLHL